VTQSKTPAFNRREPVSTAETPRPDTGLSDVQSGCDPCPDDAAAAGGGDGGELLGAWQDERSLRSGRPGPGDGSGGGDHGVRLDGYTAPVTRSPYDPWHSEEYLLGCLVRLHGWYWLRPRVLAGPWRAKRVKSFMHPEGE
jgi:hypothetical protein